MKAGRKGAEQKCRKREELKAQKSMCYSIGALLAVGVIGGLGYYLYQAKKGEVNGVPPQQPHPKTNKFEMEQLYYKMDKRSVVNDLYQVAVINVFAVGCSILGKKILKMAPLSIQKFDLEDKGKLVAIITASEMTREHLIKQKILPERINV